MGWRIRAAAAAGIAALALAGVAAAPASAQVEAVPGGGTTAIPGSYLVVFDDAGMSAQAVQSRAATLAQRHGATVEHTYTAALRGFAGAMTAEAASRLAATAGVKLVSPNRKMRAHQAASWGLDRIDQRSLPLNGTYTAPTTASNVHAYVIDTGIRTTHVDFGGRATWGANTVGDGINTDCYGHGTHVAGTLGGTAYGVAKGVQLHAVKVLDCDGWGSTATVVAGIDWVTANRVNPAVANMSLGGDADPVLDQALNASIASGVTYVVSSGNGDIWGNPVNACLLSPGSVGGAITVGATAPSDYRAYFSNTGPCVDIHAPGTSITSAWNSSDTATETIDGTSMAAPHVAGAAALHLATNPTATPAAVRAALVTKSTQNTVMDPGAGSANRLLYIGSEAPIADDKLLRAESLQSGHSVQSSDGRYVVIMQTDGNLVQYDANGAALWHTNSYGTGANRVTMQPDGNFVLYTAWNSPVWHTNTWGTSADRFVVQTDSNLVIYNGAGRYFWHRW